MAREVGNYIDNCIIIRMQLVSLTGFIYLPRYIIFPISFTQLTPKSPHYLLSFTAFHTIIGTTAPHFQLYYGASEKREKMTAVLHNISESTALDPRGAKHHELTLLA